MNANNHRLFTNGDTANSDKNNANKTPIIQFFTLLSLLSILLTSLTLLTACSSVSSSLIHKNSSIQIQDAIHQQQKQAPIMSANIPVYKSKPLYFHYFSLDIPEDINQEKAAIETSFAGNRFHAYPIESQHAFTELVESRINVFASHKLSPEALEYDKKSRANFTANDEKYARRHPPLNMTTALYKAIKYDDQHYEIIANPLSNLDATFNSAMYMQWYIYAPEQHKYIMTQQGKFPASELVEVDIQAYGKKFIENEILPLSKTTVNNSKVMAVGPIAWLTPSYHPTIDYDLKSKQYPIRIQLEARGFTGNGIIENRQKSKLAQLKHVNDGKAKHLDSGARNVVGVKGREVCYYFPLVDDIDSAYVWCSWGTDGEPENLDRPFIYLNMYYNVDGSEASRKNAIAAWEQLIGSLQRRGHS